MPPGAAAGRTTARVPLGLYQGLARAGVPAVGVERSRRRASSAIPAFARAGLSTVDSVETSAGRLALVLVLAGAEPGHYGVGDSGDERILPPVAARCRQRVS